MKKYLGLFVILALCAGAISVRAEEADTAAPTGSRASEATMRLRAEKEALQKEMQEKRAAAQTMMEERAAAAARDGQKDMRVLREKMQKMGTDLYRDIMVKRAAFGFAQMQNIQKRIESRIAKLKAAGIDTNAADTKVQAVKDAMTAATAKLEVLKQAVAAAYDTAATSTDRASLNATIKTAKADAETAVKAVRQAMDDLMKTLKTYKMPETSAAGSKVETNSGSEN